MRLRYQLIITKLFNYSLQKGAVLSLKKTTTKKPSMHKKAPYTLTSNKWHVIICAQPCILHCFYRTDDRNLMLNCRGFLAALFPALMFTLTPVESDSLSTLDERSVQ